ncbi:MAG: hypothetical protein GY719_29270 [bacterium]|nr:hypothetical protein [bacterium]
MKDGQLTVTCPDCGCDITVDVATGHVLHHETAAGEPAGGKDFEQLLAGLDDSKKRADEVFQREVSALEDRDRLMEEKFRAAMKRAQEEPDEEPPLRPWDLD